MLVVCILMWMFWFFFLMCIKVLSGLFDLVKCYNCVMVGLLIIDWIRRDWYELILVLFVVCVLFLLGRIVVWVIFLLYVFFLVCVVIGILCVVDELIFFWWLMLCLSNVCVLLMVVWVVYCNCVWMNFFYCDDGNLYCCDDLLFFIVFLVVMEVWCNLL